MSLAEFIPWTANVCPQSFRGDHQRSIGRQFLNGVGEDMDVLLSEFDLSVRARGCFMEIEIDEEKVDEAVLALLYLATFKDKPYWKAWNRRIARGTASSSAMLWLISASQEKITCL